MLGADLSIGILYIFAITSLSVYAIVLAGWASNSKFSLMGGIRSSAQIISYELAMTTAAAGVILASSSFRLGDVIAMQQGTWLGVIPRWNVIPQFIGFVVFFISAFAETNRLPFDLPEAEAELVAGYHTEYSAMRFGAFQMAEYVNVMVVSAITTTLYFGGWSLPGFHPHGVLGAIASLADLHGQVLLLRVRLHLGPLDPAPLPLRPAHEDRLEGAAAARARQPAVDRGARDVEDARMTAGRLIFDLAAAAAILFAGLMVVGRNPVRSVLSLVVAFFALAVCFVLLLAPFIAALQVIVYAGAILVLFLFVLMLLNVGRELPDKTGRPIQTVLGSAAVLVFAGLLLGMFRHSGSHVPASADPVAPAMLGDPAALARLLFSDYLLHFEAVSVLLLAALVGAFVLARREHAS